jgi:hypothetical protein
MKKLLLVIFIGMVLAMCLCGVVNELTNYESTMTVYVE